MMLFVKRLVASVAGVGLILAAMTILDGGEPGRRPNAGTAPHDPAAPRDTPRTAPAPDPPEPDRGLYRWRDQTGVIYISTEPDLAPSYAERFALPPAGLFSAAAVEHQDGRAPAGLIGMQESSPISVYSYDGLTALMNDAGRIADRLRTRRQLLETLARQL